MENFHFNLHIGGERIVGEARVPLVDRSAARHHARQAIADVLREELARGCDSIALAVYVDDSFGARVLQLTARLAVE